MAFCVHAVALIDVGSFCFCLHCLVNLDSICISSFLKFLIVDDPKKMKEDLNENTYTNDAYKLYLSDPKHEYSLQNTKVHKFYPCFVFSHEFLLRISALLT